MNISGIIKLINETKEYGSNGFKKRELVVTTQEPVSYTHLTLPTTEYV